MTRIAVTGAAGFIGSKIIEGLNARGFTDILAVDDLTQGDKFKNLAGLKIADYIDADTFYDDFSAKQFGKVEAVFHEGACSDTMESNGKFMMANNYGVSKQLFHAAQAQGTCFMPPKPKARGFCTRPLPQPTAARTPSKKNPRMKRHSMSTATPNYCLTKKYA